MCWQSWRVLIKRKWWPRRDDARPASGVATPRRQLPSTMFPKAGNDAPVRLGRGLLLLRLSAFHLTRGDRDAPLPNTRSRQARGSPVMRKDGAVDELSRLVAEAM